MMAIQDSGHAALDRSAQKEDQTPGNAPPGSAAALRQPGISPPKADWRISVCKPVQAWALRGDQARQTRNSSMEFTIKLAGLIDRVERGIDRMLPAADADPSRLHGAMRYSLQAGGKRLDRK